MLNELQWESLESRREQSCLIMLCNILKQNIYFPSEYIPEFHTEILQYQLQTRSCHMLNYLCHIVTLMFLSTPLYRVQQDYGIPYLIKLLRQLQQTLLNY